MVGGMVGLIPLAFVTGLALKVAGKVLPKESEALTSKRRQKRKKDIYSREYVGDFSNVGW